MPIRDMVPAIHAYTGIMHCTSLMTAGCFILLVSMSATLFAAERSDPPTPAASAQAEAIHLHGVPGWFQLAHGPAWTPGNGQGFITLDGANQVQLRIYAIGLRSAGGKYRNLEHVVDDSIFQMRDEFGGSVGTKRSIDVATAGGVISGRQVDGVFTQDGTTFHAIVTVIPHPVDGVVLSIQHRAETADALAASSDAIARLVATLELASAE